MTDSRSNVVLHQNDIRDVTFQLRRLGRREVFDVTGQLLRLRCARLDTPQDDELEPLTADPTHPDANYATGKVVIRVDRSITQLVGTYRYSLEIIQQDGQSFVLQTGKLEVKAHPAFSGEFTLTGVIDVDVLLSGDFVVS